LVKAAPPWDPESVALHVLLGHQPMKRVIVLAPVADHEVAFTVSFTLSVVPQLMVVRR
jgi:hypothetical protein